MNSIFIFEYINFYFTYCFFQYHLSPLFPLPPLPTPLPPQLLLSMSMRSLSLSLSNRLTDREKADSSGGRGWRDEGKKKIVILFIAKKLILL